MTARRPLTAKRARETVEGARLVKAPDWAESRHWHVITADGAVLVVVAPSYGGVTRTGWRWWLADLGPSGSRDRWTTRDQASAAGLAAWERWATTPRR